MSVGASQHLLNRGQTGLDISINDDDDPQVTTPFPLNRGQTSIKLTPKPYTIPGSQHLLNRGQTQDARLEVEEAKAQSQHLFLLIEVKPSFVLLDNLTRALPSQHLFLLIEVKPSRTR
ncbi:MAG: hypothetical protein BRC45_04165 [Cyanobacteria bacterium QS_5_48_63]|nr:MAG: hypothetical protein BRC45_04165 [Cyanobacteria bacterium QS_5_48_63]